MRGKFFFSQPPELTNESLCINRSISGLFLRHILLHLSAPAADMRPFSPFPPFFNSHGMPVVKESEDVDELTASIACPLK